ncbi:MAG: hypothetical protein KW802_02690 [Candidatus Doudnabacteria bacterium]|nr:hypothetical protein [Candidatus Doudnabacteria bacterium]
MAECEVYTKKDRTGVFVHATERNSNKLFYDSSFTTNKGVKWPKVVNKGTRGGAVVAGPHPNVFFPRCQREASRLPAEVRALFFGYGNIK